MAKANLIGGEWVEGATTVADVNPSDLSDAVGEYAVADDAQVAVEHRTESLGALLTQQRDELRILAPTLQSGVEPRFWHATQHRNRYARRKVSTASTRRWSSAAGARPSLLKMLVTCFSTARSVTTSCSAIAALRAALRHQLEHLALARGEVLERVVAPRRGPAAGPPPRGRAPSRPRPPA